MTTKKAAHEPAQSHDAISATVDARSFKNALSALARHKEAGTSAIPILNYVTLEAEAGRGALKVSHYGVDMAISLELDAEPGAHGTAVVPLRTLESFMSGADGETVSIYKPASTEGSCRFECGEFTARLLTLPSRDVPSVFPPLPGNAEDFRRVAMPEGVFNWLCGLSLPFVSTEETRYYLNGVCFEFSKDGDDKIRAVATDGHRLGMRESSVSGILEPREPCIVPRFAMAAVHALAGQAEVEFSLAGHKAEFSFGRATIRTKLIDGTFPDWRRVVPDMTDAAEIEMDAGKVKRFVKSVGGLSGGRRRAGYGGDVRAIKVAPTDGGIRLEATSPDMGDMSAKLPAADMPDFQAFGINGRYLAAMADALGDRRFRLRTKTPSEPMTLASRAGRDGELCVLMPMRV